MTCVTQSEQISGAIGIPAIDQIKMSNNIFILLVGVYDTIIDTCTRYMYMYCDIQSRIHIS